MMMIKFCPPFSLKKKKCFIFSIALFLESIDSFKVFIEIGVKRASQMDSLRDAHGDGASAANGASAGHAAGGYLAEQVRISSLALLLKMLKHGTRRDITLRVCPMIFFL